MSAKRVEDENVDFGFKLGQAVYIVSGAKYCPVFIAENITQVSRSFEDSGEIHSYVLESGNRFKVKASAGEYEQDLKLPENAYKIYCYAGEGFQYSALAHMTLEGAKATLEKRQKAFNADFSKASQYIDAAFAKLDATPEPA